MNIDMNVSFTQLQNKSDIENAILACSTYFYDKNSIITKSASLFAKKYSTSASVYIAVNNKAIIGFLAFYHNDIISKQGYISAIAINPKYQGKKIGKALMTIAIEKCREKNMSSLFLEVSKSNTNAIGFYEHLGFIRLSKETDNSYFYNITV